MLKTLIREAYYLGFGQVLERRRRPWSPPPLKLNLNLTRRCNLKCLMCEQYRHGDRPQGLSWYDPKEELPLAPYVALFNQVEYFRPRVYFTGGEPLLYPHFKELAMEARRRGFPVNLQTNGTRLGEVAEFLVTLGIERITVSIDGPPAVHDRIRGQEGAFARTQEGLKAVVDARLRLKRPGPIILLNCVISKDNVTVFKDMVPLAQSLGADFLQLQHAMFNSPHRVARHNQILSPSFAAAQDLDLVPPSIPPEEFYESLMGPEDLPQLQAGLAQVRREARGRLRLLLLPDLPDSLLGPYYLDLDYAFPQVCDDLWKSFRVMPDGTVSPCFHLVMGNIAEQSFDEIWNGPRMQRFRELIHARLLPGCVRCCSRRFT
jgi:MoaA/NifB/PqqE/SkfB family radical SAM enzyme